RPAAGVDGGGPVDERHDRDGGAARRRKDHGVAVDLGSRRNGDPSLRRGGGALPRGPPGGAQWRYVEALAFEQPRRRGQVLLAFAELASTGECVQQELV